MMRFFTFFKLPNSNLKNGLFLCIGITMVAGVFFMMKMPNQKHLSPISAQINRVEIKLATLTRQLQHTPAPTLQQIEKIEQELKTIRQTIIMVRSEIDVKKLETLITDKNQQVMSQFQALQKMLQQYKQRFPSRSFLSPASLPFKVFNIDIWNGEPKLTIKINDRMTLMAKEETYLGWTLKDVSFMPAFALFSNVKNQHIKISL